MSTAVQLAIDEDDERSAVIERFVCALGPDRAVELFLTFGGSALYLSERSRPESRLVKAVGDGGALALFKEYGAGHVSVPLANVWMARHLDAQGVSRADITRRLRISRNSLRRYLADESCEAA